MPKDLTNEIHPGNNASADSADSIAGLARDVDVGLHKSSAQPTRASNSPKVWFRRIKQKACKCRLFV
jgi:hypothetical protein